MKFRPARVNRGVGFFYRHVDPVTGTVLVAHSKAESDAIRSLLWVPGHAELLTHFNLEQASTVRLAAVLGIRHPRLRDGSIAVMTTTLVHIINEGTTMEKMYAYSVKNTPDLDARTIDLLKIERAFWTELGVPWQLLIRPQIPTNRIENVRWFENFSPRSVLIPAKDRAREVELTLYPLVTSGMPLNEACARVDIDLGLKAGTALTHVRMFLHAWVWVVDLDVRINTLAPLQILARNLNKLP
jgi:hypothetical protein